MTQNNAQSCDCVFLRHDLIHSCTPLQNLLCIFFITYHGSSLRKTKTSGQQAVMVISHKQTTSPYSDDPGNKTEGRNPDGTAKVVPLLGWIPRRGSVGPRILFACTRFSGERSRSWLRNCATRWEVPVSIPSVRIQEPWAKVLLWG
jgi:hypothetical protein